MEDNFDLERTLHKYRSVCRMKASLSQELLDDMLAFHGVPRQQLEQELADTLLSCYDDPPVPEDDE